MVLKNDKIIEINCDDETEGYSCVINCGLKYISEHFKNSNIIFSSPFVSVNEDVIISLLKKIANPKIGLIVPTVLINHKESKCNKLLTLSQELFLRLPFVYRREIKKKPNIVCYEFDELKDDVSTVGFSNLLFFVTKEHVMRKIDYFDENVKLNYEEEILAKKLIDNNYNWSISKNDIVESASSLKMNVGSNYKKLRASRKYYFRNYLSKNMIDKIFLRLCLFIDDIKNLFIGKIRGINIINKIKNFSSLVVDAIKKSWNQYHFVIPPRMLKRYFQQFMYKLKYNSFSVFDDERYNEWVCKKNSIAINHKYLSYKPLISIFIVTNKESSIYLLNSIDSILNQSYDKFDIHVIDNGDLDSNLIKDLHKYDKKINLHINKNKNKKNIITYMNKTINNCDGEYVLMLRANDVLHEEALYDFASLINTNTKVDLIYTDEDTITKSGKFRCPVFKADWSPDTLLSFNYIGDEFIVKKDIFKKIGGYSQEFINDYNYDFLLRLSEFTTNIYHISDVLYHSYKIILNNIDQMIKEGKKAIENALLRRSQEASVKIVNENNTYFVEYKHNHEMVSIIMLTRDHVEYLKTCIESIYEKTTYKNFELIIVDHCTVQKEALKYLQEIQNKYDNIKVIRKEGEFNYSYLNNEAVKMAKGKYFIFLNSDIKIITPNWIELMLGYARQEHIGCVGCKLLYADKTIQHGGVLLGIGGVAGHAFAGSIEEKDYCNRLKVPYNYSAVTFACVMVKSDKFYQINGLNEDLKCAFNDVDFCLRLLEKGYYNVFVPQVEMFHYESKIRGLDNKGEKLKRFLREVKYLNNHWESQINNDKFYNKNLSKIIPFYIER